MDDHPHNHSHDHHHHHEHEHNVQNKKCCCKLSKTQSFIIMLFLTTGFFLAEIIVGNITKSNTLVADAMHMLSDVIALIIGLIAVRMSKRESPNNTFGWVRAEILGSLVNSVFLLALCFSILIEAINRFIEPEPIEKVELMLIIGGVGLGINILGLIIFGSHGHEHGHSHGGGSSSSHKKKDDDAEFGSQATEISVIGNDIARVEGVITALDEDKTKKKMKKKKINMNIHGVFLHVLSDALGSIAVLISGLIVKYAPPKDDSTITWKLYIDPALSVAIIILISISVIPLIKESSLVLLQTVPSQFKIDELKTLIKSVKGVLNVSHLHVWSLNSEKIIASAHITATNEDDVKELNFKIKQLFHKLDIHSITLQFDYQNEISEYGKRNDFCELKECYKRQCCKVRESTTEL